MRAVSLERVLLFLALLNLVILGLDVAYQALSLVSLIAP
jgi:hypothetical protein